MGETRRVSAYFDGRSDLESGWVARCTEYEDGWPVMGRIAMEEPLECDDPADAELARQLAADLYGVRAEDVEIESRSPR